MVKFFLTLDYDACIDLFSKELTEKYSYFNVFYLYLILEQIRTRFLHFVDERAKETKATPIVYNGSLRQTPAIDKDVLECHVKDFKTDNGLCLTNLPNLCKEKGWLFETLSVDDPDQEKLKIFIAQLEDITKKHPEDEIHWYFFDDDDRDIIFNAFQQWFSKNGDNVSNKIHFHMMKFDWALEYQTQQKTLVEVAAVQGRKPTATPTVTVTASPSSSVRDSATSHTTAATVAVPTQASAVQASTPSTSNSNNHTTIATPVETQAPTTVRTPATNPATATTPAQLPTVRTSTAHHAATTVTEPAPQPPTVRTSTARRRRRATTTVTEPAQPPTVRTSTARRRRAATTVTAPAQLPTVRTSTARRAAPATVVTAPTTQPSAVRVSVVTPHYAPATATVPTQLSAVVSTSALATPTVTTAVPVSTVKGSAINDSENNRKNHNSKARWGMFTSSAPALKDNSGGVRPKESKKTDAALHNKRSRSC